MTYGPPPIPVEAPPRVWKPLLITIGSMLGTIAVYALTLPNIVNVQDAWLFATVFTLATLVHELGHVAALKWYRMKAGMPVFIPFVGAFVRMTQPPNARVEAVVGIAGPIAGLLAGMVIFVVAHAYSGMPRGYDLMFAAYITFLINLLNMLPVPPLDGARVTAAVSPWIWLLGLVAVAVLGVQDFMNGSLPVFPILILFYAVPRVMNTLRYRYTDHPYYQIGFWWPKILGAAYLLLGLVLFVMTLAARG